MTPQGGVPDRLRRRVSSGCYGPRVRTRKLSLQVTGYSDGQWCVAVIETEFGSLGTGVSRVITQVFADELQVLDVAARLLQQLVDRERPISL